MNPISRSVPARSALLDLPSPRSVSDQRSGGCRPPHGPGPLRSPGEADSPAGTHDWGRRATVSTSAHGRPRQPAVSADPHGRPRQPAATAAAHGRPPAVSTGAHGRSRQPAVSTGVHGRPCQPAATAAGAGAGSSRTGAAGNRSRDHHTAQREKQVTVRRVRRGNCWCRVIYRVLS